MSDETATRPSTGAPEYLIVGQVVAPFGVKGEVKVNVLTEFPDRFKNLREAVLAPFSSIEPGLAPTAALDPSTVRSALEPPSKPLLTQATPFAVEASQMHKGQAIVKLGGVDSVGEAEALRGCWLLVPLEQARKLPMGSFYIYQLVGLGVFTTAGEHIGKIADVLTTSANDVYVVKGPGVRSSSGELLVPAIKSVVREIDPDGGKVVIAPPEEWS